LEAASAQDPAVLRGYARIGSVLSLPEEVLGEPGFLDRVIEAGAGWRDTPSPGPDRGRLVAALSS
jgi:hypothetical protein